MESVALDRVDLTPYHDCNGSDSGYISFEETQLGENSNTGCGIEGRGRNCGPRSDTGGYPYQHPEYEIVYIKEGAQQLEQQADLRIRMNGGGSFRSEDIMAGSYGGCEFEDEDRYGCRRRTPEMNVENLMEQQMSLMRELMQMLNAQIVHL